MQHTVFCFFFLLSFSTKLFSFLLLRLFKFAQTYFIIFSIKWDLNYSSFFCRYFTHTVCLIERKFCKFFFNFNRQNDGNKKKFLIFKWVVGFGSGWRSGADLQEKKEKRNKNGRDTPFCGCVRKKIIVVFFCIWLR